MKDYYENQVKNYSTLMDDMSGEINTLNAENQKLQDTILNLYSQINDG